ncbi:hypothetical protein NRIC_35810 [Enterococcus florum]|uniref:Resolvase/invertase-type recombinase catalytic domain-containing protein n=1 Tax=Enterococcus florum TaxID=2480627 RepID=A0A4P5PC81_9ENTE|nr:recombinase family protein [Enterococcus florum]GCF95690.1 hypothetical protein NRIC_35810 [Enterococcus florum]
MRLGYVYGPHAQRQQEKIEYSGIDEWFVDQTGGLLAPASEFTALLAYGQPGDMVVVASLEVLSRDYQLLLRVVDQLEERGMELDVVTLPLLSLPQWREVFQWSAHNERMLYPRLIQLSREKPTDKRRYSLFSKDPEAKGLYREILRLLLEKQSVRQIAYEKRVPIETVYRIKQELGKVQLALTMLACFFLAIFSIKIVELYFDHLLLQVLICLVLTGVILWNVLSDSQQEG